MKELRWPPLPGGSSPRWTVDGFDIDGRRLPFLPYSQNLAGWDDALTDLHASEAGGAHPIDVSSRAVVCRALDRYKTQPLERILEIGCSEGYLLHDLKHRYPEACVVGSDVAGGALEKLHSAQPGLPLLQMDLLNCPLPSDSFDAVIALNVLEHIEEDREALKQMARLLASGGLCIIEVPAGPSLYDAYDARLRHFRRYAMADLVAKIESVGFKVLWRTHFGVFVYPGFVAVKWLNRKRTEAETAGDSAVSDQIRKTHNGFIDSIFKLERLTALAVRWPFGIRAFVVAKKPNQIPAR